MGEKEIEIKCKGAGTLDLDCLVELQGDLKTINDENLNKLKRSILKNGFTAPIFIWKSDKCYIIDGHQRNKALNSLKREGYIIPPIPVVYIEAGSVEEAKEKLLSITSQYGEFNFDELNEWLGGSDTDYNFAIDFTDSFDPLGVSIPSKKNIKPYKKVHYLISVDVDKIIEVNDSIRAIRSMEGVEVEQSQN